MTHKELAQLFIELYDEDIKKQLKLDSFNKNVALKHVAETLKDLKTRKPSLTKKDILLNKSMTKDIIGGLHNALVPDHVQKIRAAQAKINGKKIGKQVIDITREVTSFKRYYNK